MADLIDRQPDVPDTNVGDMISRQVAIDILYDFAGCIVDTPIGDYQKAYQAYRHKLETLPPAQPDLDEWCYSCKEYNQEKHCCPRWNRVIRNAVEEIKNTQPEPRWIPVEERLPKDGQRVLVTDEDGEIEIACFIDFSSIDESAEWWSHDYRCHPIAWSELPKPYERSEDA